MAEQNQRSEITQRLTDVFREVFEDDNIELRDEMSADDIEEWDSLMHIALVVATEKEFGIRLNAAEVGNLNNVGAMIGLIQERTQS